MPAIKGLGVNPGELNQLFVSLEMTAGSKHSVERIIHEIKTENNPAKKALLITAAISAASCFAIAKGLSPVLFEGPAGGANPAILLDTFYNNFVAGCDSFLQENKDKIQESSVLKWMHAVQAGIGTYNAAHSAISVGSMVSTYLETGSFNPLAKIKTEQDLIETIETGKQHLLFGESGWFFGKVLRAEQGVIQGLKEAVIGIFTRSSRERSSDKPSPQLTIIKIGEANYYVERSAEDGSILSVIKIGSDGETAVYHYDAENQRGRFLTPEELEATLVTTASEADDTSVSESSEASAELEEAEARIQQPDQLLEESIEQAWAEHDFFIEGLDGWAWIRIDLKPGEDLHAKIDRLLSGSHDDTVEYLSGEQVRELSPEMVAQIAGPDGILEGQIYRDLFQPIVNEAQSRGILPETLRERFVEFFAPHLMDGENTRLVTGQFSITDLRRFLFQAETSGSTSQSGLLAPPITILEDVPPPIYRNHDNTVIFTVNPGEGFLSSLRSVLPNNDDAVAIYRQVLSGEIRVEIITSRGIERLRDINTIPSGAEIRLRAENGDTALSTIPVLESSRTIIDPYPEPEAVVGDRSAPSQDLVTQGIEDAPSETLEIPQVSSSVPLLLEEISAFGDFLVPGQPEQPSLVLSREAIGMIQKSEAGELILLGIIPPGGSVSEQIRKAIPQATLSEGVEGANTEATVVWQIINEAARSSQMNIVVLDPQTGQVVREVGPDNKWVVHPGELIAIQTDYSAIENIPEYVRHTEKVRPHFPTDDPNAIIARQSLLSHLQRLTKANLPDELAAPVLLVLEKADSIIKEDNVYVLTRGEKQLVFDPVTGQLIYFPEEGGSFTEIVPGVTSILPSIDLPPSITSLRVDLTRPDSIPQAILQIERAVSIQVNSGLLPIPPEFSHAYQILVINNQTGTESSPPPTLEQAWINALTLAYIRESSSHGPSGETLEARTSIAPNQEEVLRAFGLQPLRQLGEDGLRCLPWLPLHNSAADNKTETAERLGVEDPTRLVFIHTDSDQVKGTTVTPCLTPDDTSTPEKMTIFQVVREGKQLITADVQTGDQITNVYEIPVSSRMSRELLIPIGEDKFLDPLTLQLFERSADDGSPKLTLVRQTPNVEGLFKTMSELLARQLSKHIPFSQFDPRGRFIFEESNLSLSPVSGQGGNEVIYVDSQGRLVVFNADLPSPADSARSFNGKEFEPVAMNNIMPLEAFLIRYDLSPATLNGESLHLNGQLVFVNSEGLLFSWQPGGVRLLGSTADPQIMRLLEPISTGDHDSFFNTRTASLDDAKPTEAAATLVRRHEATLTTGEGLTNMIIGPNGKIFYQGLELTPTAHDFITPDGKTILEDSQGRFYVIGENSIDPLAPGQADFDTIAQIMKETGLHEPVINKKTGFWPLTRSSPEATLVHVPTGLPVIESPEGLWFVRTLSGFREIGDPTTLLSKGAVQAQDSQGNLRPLSLNEVAGTSPQNLSLRDVAEVQLGSVDRFVTRLFSTVFPKIDAGSLNEQLARSRLEIDSQLTTLIIQSEDQGFHLGTGHSTIGIIRAVVDSIRGREFGAGGGGSSLAMQVARLYFIEEGARAERSIFRKIKELGIASQLRVNYSDTELLQLYLESANYGDGNLPGIEAGAQHFFARSTHNLTLAQEIMLIVVPQQPAVFNFDNPINTERWIRRSLTTVRQLQSRGILTNEQAFNISNEIRSHLPSINGQDVPLIISQLNSPQQVSEAISVLKKLAIDHKNRHPNVLLELHRAHVITEDEMISIGRRFSDSAARNQNSQPLSPEKIAFQLRSSPLAFEVSDESLAQSLEISANRRSTSLQDAPTVLMELAEIRAINSPSATSDDLRISYSRGFLEFLESQGSGKAIQDLLRSNWSLRLEETKAALDGTFSFTLENGETKERAIILAQKVESDSAAQNPDWQIVTVLSKETLGVEFIDAREQVRAQATRGVEPGEWSGLRTNNNELPSVTFHELGLKGIAGGVFPDSLQSLLWQVRNQRGSHYHIAVRLDSHGEITQVIYLADPTQVSEGILELTSDPRFLQRNIDVLLVYDELNATIPVTQKIAQSVHRLLGRLEHEINWINPEGVSGHGELPDQELTGCMRTFSDSPADEATITSTFYSLNPDPSPRTSQAEMRQFLLERLGKQAGSDISLLDIMRLGASIDELAGQGLPIAEQIGPGTGGGSLADQAGNQGRTTTQGLTIGVGQDEQVLSQALSGTRNRSRSSPLLIQPAVPPDETPTAWAGNNIFEHIERNPGTQAWVAVDGERTLFNSETGQVAILSNRVDGRVQITPLSEEGGMLAFEITNERVEVPIAVKPIDVSLLPNGASLKNIGTGLFLGEGGVLYKEATASQVNQGHSPLRLQRVGQVVLVPSETDGLVIITSVEASPHVGSPSSSSDITAASVANLLFQARSVDPETTTQAQSSSPTLLEQIIKSIEPTNNLPAHTGFQDPFNLAEVLSDRGLRSKGLSLRPNTRGQNLARDIIQSVTGAGKSIIVWLDYTTSSVIESTPTPDSNQTNSSGRTFFANENPSLPVTVRAIERINGVEYVIFEIASGIGGRKTAALSALPMQEFLDLTTQGHQPIRMLVVGDTEKQLNPFDHRITDNAVAPNSPEMQVATALTHNSTALEGWRGATHLDEAFEHGFSQRLLEILPPTRQIGDTQIPTEVRAVALMGTIPNQSSADGDAPTNMKVIAMISGVFDETTQAFRKTNENKACTTATAPASIAKILTAVAALNNGVGFSDRIRAGLFYDLGGTRVFNHTLDSIWSPPTVTLAQMLKLSNNPAALRIVAEIVGPKEFVKFIERTGIPGASRNIPGLQWCSEGVVEGPMLDDLGRPIPPSDGYLALTSFGQGPLALTNADVALWMTTLATEGKPFTVELVKGEPGDPNINLPLTTEKFAYLNQALRNAAQTTVLRGIPHWTVYGKTGTAETNVGVPTSRFAGYARMNGTDTVVTFSVEVPFGREATTVVKELLAQIYAQQNSTPNSSLAGVGNNEEAETVVVSGAGDMMR